MLKHSSDTRNHPLGTVRRKYLRYPVSGSLSLDAGSHNYAGVPINLGLGGILFQADPTPPDKTLGTLQLQVTGFNETIVAEVRVIRTLGSTAAAVFLTPSAMLVRCIAMLAG